MATRMINAHKIWIMEDNHKKKMDVCGRLYTLIQSKHIFSWMKYKQFLEFNTFFNADIWLLSKQIWFRVWMLEIYHVYNQHFHRVKLNRTEKIHKIENMRKAFGMKNSTKTLNNNEFETI